MLTQLHIRQFAIVEYLDVDFQNGMSAITGETGAGKSIALDALGLCLGDRAESESVRPGAEKAEITAVFSLSSDSAATAWLHQHEFFDDDAKATEVECVLRRVITREGRSKAWINGVPVTLAQLKSLAPLLVNIHGQHEHQLLSRDEHQLDVLDRYARHQQHLEAAVTAYQAWYETKKKLKHSEQQQAEQEAKRELLSYQVQELDEFNIQEGEFEQLENDHKRLAHVATLREESLFALNAIFEGEHNNAYGLVQSALERLQQQTDKDAALAPIAQLLADAGVQIEEAALELRHYQAEMKSSDEDLEVYEQRVSYALKLAKKHQVPANLLWQHHAHLKSELTQIAEREEANEALQVEVKEAARHYRAHAKILSESRKQAAKELSQQISSSIQQLNMPHARFVVEVEHQEHSPATKRGTDSIQFLVSANPGQPLQELGKIASGGELSRLSLAIQVVTAAQVATPTLMFDEVDVGVSGPTAATVGRMLRQLGQHTQVICVTHLPQVAAKADQQLVVEKSNDGASTQTSMRLLNSEHRVIELARLLGGDEITETTKANAIELLAS